MSWMFVRTVVAPDSRHPLAGFLCPVTLIDGTYFHTCGALPGIERSLSTPAIFAPQELLAFCTVCIHTQLTIASSNPASPFRLSESHTLSATSTVLLSRLPRLYYIAPSPSLFIDLLSPVHILLLSARAPIVDLQITSHRRWALVEIISMIGAMKDFCLGVVQPLKSMVAEIIITIAMTTKMRTRNISILQNLQLVWTVCPA